jgi:hypothetical protein
MRSSKWSLVLVLASGFAASTHAQGINSNAEAPRDGETVVGNTRVVEIDEVERGLFTSLDYGITYYVPLAQPGFLVLNPTWLTPSTRIGLRVGYDILNNIALDGFVAGVFSEGIIDKDDLAVKGLTGDLTSISVGLGARFAFVTTERLFVYARVGAGYALWFPEQLAGSFGSIHVDVAGGVEYYTKLRHLSVGVELGGQALLLPFAFAAELRPVVKYTF